MIAWKLNRVLSFALAVVAAVVCSPAARAQAQPGLTLSTTAFEDGGIIPEKYTAAAGAAAVSPHLVWTHVPDGVVSFVLLEHDPDTSVNKTSEEILHWMIFNIPGAARELPEGVPAQAISTQPGQPVDAAAKISRLNRDQDLPLRRDLQHQSPLHRRLTNAARSAAS